MKARNEFETQWKARSVNIDASKREAEFWFQRGRAFGEQELQRRQEANMDRETRRLQAIAAGK